MKKFLKRSPILFVLFLLLLASVAVVMAAPLMWSYPDDHLLISEVEYYGAPGAEPGSEWIEIYNPTDHAIQPKEFGVMAVESSEETVAIFNYPITPTPGAPEYPLLDSYCFMYIANDANSFFNEYGQCPDYAENLDPVNCPETLSAYTDGSWTNTGIAQEEASICLLSSGSSAGHDSVGWGTSTGGAYFCETLNRLSPSATAGESYLRGSDSPEYIGPGGEGTETSGPRSEQLDEVWHLSGSVNVPWEGVEVGACRRPTAIAMQQGDVAAATGRNMLPLGGLLLTGLLLSGGLLWYVRAGSPPREDEA